MGTVIRDFYLSVSYLEPEYRCGGGDLHLVNTTAARELFVKNGIDEQKIVVTGDCGMDYLFKNYPPLMHRK